MAEIIKDRVKESSTTTGTGPFTVSGAGTGFRTFGSVCSVGDTFRCSMVADNGDWQVGVARYSAANQVTFDSVVDSSNSGSPVNFGAGTKQLFIGMDATEASWIRERLTAARTYYVRTDGNDSNTGLVNTTGGAFLTIQKAVNVAMNSIDADGYAVTIQLGDGTYAGPIVVSGQKAGSGTLTIQGNSSTPANVLLSTGASAAVTAQNGAVVTIKDFKITTLNSGIYATKTGQITFSGIDFGSVSSHHIRVDDGGGVVCSGNYTISGPAVTHFRLVGGFLRVQSKTITISGSPTFSGHFTNVGYLGLAFLDAITFSGSATGTRYLVELNGVCYTNSGGGAYFPGSVAGSTATGGQYV